MIDLTFAQASRTLYALDFTNSTLFKYEGGRLWAAGQVVAERDADLPLPSFLTNFLPAIYWSQDELTAMSRYVFTFRGNVFYRYDRKVLTLSSKEGLQGSFPEGVFTPPSDLISVAPLWYGFFMEAVKASKKSPPYNNQ